MRKYENMECYPDEENCPPDTFNTWRKFAAENITEYTEKPEELKMILNHIKILCGNEDVIFAYIIKWIAHMIQFPEQKSICPVMISNQGAGKEFFIQLMRLMLGNSKVFQTTNPGRDVWGNFNGMMASSFLVNLNEISRKDTFDAEGFFKGITTDQILLINEKGLKSFLIKSFHRFIITTNNYHPIATSKDDRRNLIIRCSDEKCGDKEYFKTLYSTLEDPNVIKTCYEYFKSLKGIRDFIKIPIPETEYHRVLKDSSISPIELWVRSVVSKNLELQEVEMKSSECFRSYKEFCDRHGFKDDTNSNQFNSRLYALKIVGIESKHSKLGNVKSFNIKKLKNHFKIDDVCLF
jgi:hypothetical protein